ncbi:MAG: hypothetical protein JW902_18015 [Syntrophaceae bacterium]|nr:hypothetical protein [Syntrophaceae bacterium]
MAGTKHLFTILVGCLFIITFAFPVWAEDAVEAEEGVSGEVSVAVMSQYIDRGQELSRHSVIMQPSFTLNYKGFSVNVWGSWDSDPYLEDEDQWYETDYTLSYAGEYGLLNYEVGYCYYDMDSYDDSQDVYASLGMNVLLNPTLTVYREVAHDLYWYLVLDISHEFPLTEKLSLELCASAAYLASNDKEEYPEVDGDGNETGHEFDNFHDGTLTVNLPYSVSDSFTITPTLSYTFPLCSEARREMDYFSMNGKDHNFIYGGANFTYSF